MKTLTLSALAIALLSLYGCKKDETLSSGGDSTKTSETQTDEQKPASNRTLVGGPMKDGEDVAVMETSAGKIILRFFPNKAPETVKNFIKLANQKFYDGIKFHRTIPGFMIQGGDPNTKDQPQQTWGAGGPGYTIRDEVNDMKHEPGILSMAKTSEPNSGGSQFFIMTGVAPHLDGVHTIFGEVVQGMDVVDNIVRTPTTDQNGTVDPKMAKTITSVKIEKWPLKG